MCVACREYDSIVSEPDLLVQTREDSRTGFVIVKTLDIVAGADVENLFQMLHDTEMRTRWETKLLKAEKIVVPFTEFEEYQEGTVSA